MLSLPATVRRRTTGQDRCSDGNFYQQYRDIMVQLRDNLQSTLASELKNDRGQLLNNEMAFLTEKGHVGVTQIVNSLEYAWDIYDEYAKQLHKHEGNGVLFVSMNPSSNSPTGIPHGDKDAVSKFMGIKLSSKQLEALPKCLSNDKPCKSGQRFWRYMQAKFGSSDNFFRHCFVINYCPLIFINENWTVSLDILKHSNSCLLQKLMKHCDDALKFTIQALKPRSTIGIGQFALQKVAEANDIFFIRHPAPMADSSYATNWDVTMEQQLKNCADWQSLSSRDH